MIEKYKAASLEFSQPKITFQSNNEDKKTYRVEAKKMSLSIKSIKNPKPQKVSRSRMGILQL
jgi:hypothetical protein